MSEGALGPAYAHCESLLKEADRSLWLASLFAPAGLRPHLQAIEAFLIEIGAVRDKVREPLAGELRLQWWTDAIEGEARGDVRGHPVAAALIDTIRARKLPRVALTALIEAKRADLYDEPIVDMAALDAWADERTGAAIALRVATLSDASDRLADVIRPAGRTTGMLAAITALGRPHAGRTEVRLPLDLLAAQGIGTAEVAIRQPGPALRAVLEAVSAHARAELAALRASRRNIPDVAGPAFLTVNFVAPLLRRLVRQGYDPFAVPLTLPQWRKQLILWRAARQNGVL